MSIQNILCWMFSKVYYHWLLDHSGRKWRVVRVKGWRTARTVSKGGQVQTSTPLFKIGRRYL